MKLFFSIEKYDILKPNNDFLIPVSADIYDTRENLFLSRIKISFNIAPKF